MTVFERLRIYHAVLAVTAILGYVSGEWGLIHSWIGYGLALVIAFRLLWALSGEPQLGLTRFAPSFRGFKLDGALTHPVINRSLVLAIGLSLLTVTATGIALDRGEALSAPAFAQEFGDDDNGGGEDDEGLEEAVEELHEVSADFMLITVIIHAAYVLIFRRPLAFFMLFLPKPRT